jgi:NitT/TauT family transport system permease protein
MPTSATDASLDTTTATDLSRLESGLDNLETGGTHGPSTKSYFLKLLSPLIAIAVIVLIWQIVFWLRLQPDYVLPGPAQVWQALANQAAQDLLWQSVLNSVRRAAQGFLISIVVATPIGLALGFYPKLRAIFGPILTGLQQLPSVAWVPAAIIWFGLSDATIFTVVLLGAVPSIANGLLAGMDQIPPIILRAGQVMGARGLGRTWRIVLPAAWPGYLAGLEQGWAFAWRSLMAAELIAVSPALGPGLGQMLDQGRTLGDMALILGAIVMIMAVGILIERLVFAPLRQRTLRNRGLIR